MTLQQQAEFTRERVKFLQNNMACFNDGRDVKVRLFLVILVTLLMFVYLGDPIILEQRTVPSVSRQAILHKQKWTCS